MVPVKSAFQWRQLDQGHRGYYPLCFPEWQREKERLWELLIHSIIDCAGADRAWYHLVGDTLDDGILKSVGFLSETRHPFYIDAIRFPGGVGYVNGRAGVQLSKDPSFPRPLFECGLRHEFAAITVHEIPIPPDAASAAAAQLFAERRPVGVVTSLILCKFGEWIELIGTESPTSTRIQDVIDEALQVDRS
jgi:hypothetical protein